MSEPFSSFFLRILVRCVFNNSIYPLLAFSWCLPEGGPTYCAIDRKAGLHSVQKWFFQSWMSSESLVGLGECYYPDADFRRLRTALELSRREAAVCQARFYEGHPDCRRSGGGGGGGKQREGQQDSGCAVRQRAWLKYAN